jgi:hypothetical protein
VTEEEAQTKLELMVLADEDPALSSDQVADCLTYARRPDEDDNDYADAAWTPTWDLDAAAAEGWRRKAGIAAARFNFAEDSQRFDRAQIYAHCLSQAAEYSRRSMGSIPNTA